MHSNLFSNDFKYIFGKYFFCLVIFSILIGQLTYSIHPDHTLTLKVVEGMIANGDFLSSWEKFDLPSYFKYPNTNFAGYHTTLAALIRLFGMDASSESTYFLLNFVFLTMATIFILYVVFKHIESTYFSIIVALAFLVNFQIFQDWHYYRPESFSALFASILMYGVFQKSRFWNVLAVLSYAILLATKISFLLLGPFLLWLFVKQDRPAAYYRWAIPFGLIIILLFNQSIVFEYSSFMYGNKFLILQYGSKYSSIWLPHGYPDSSVLTRLGHGLYYQIVSNFGFLFVGILTAAISNKRHVWVLSAIIAVFCLYFSTKSVFFERNITFLNYLAILALALSYDGLTNKVKKIAIIWLSISAVVSVINILVFTEKLDLRPKSELDISKLEDRPILGVTPEHNFEDLEPVLKENHTYHIIMHGAGHPIIDTHLKKIDGWDIIGKKPSRMWYFPPSTVHTYHHPSLIYMFSSSDLPFDKCEHLGACGPAFVSDELTVFSKPPEGGDINNPNLVRVVPKPGSNTCNINTQNSNHIHTVSASVNFDANAGSGLLIRTGWDTSNLKLIVRSEGKETNIPLVLFDASLPEFIQIPSYWRWIDLSALVGQQHGTATLSISNINPSENSWVHIIGACSERPTQ